MPQRPEPTRRGQGVASADRLTISRPMPRRKESIREHVARRCSAPTSASDPQHRISDARGASATVPRPGKRDGAAAGQAMARPPICSIGFRVHRARARRCGGLASATAQRPGKRWRGLLSAASDFGCTGRERDGAAAWQARWRSGLASAMARPPICSKCRRMGTRQIQRNRFDWSSSRRRTWESLRAGLRSLCRRSDTDLERHRCRQ
jgi:hypothetical protein